MNLLLDEGLPLRLAGLLRDRHIDTCHVLELSMQGCSDESVLAEARQRQAILVSLDADFHHILATTGFHALR